MTGRGAGVGGASGSAAAGVALLEVTKPRTALGAAFFFFFFFLAFFLFARSGSAPSIPRQPTREAARAPSCASKSYNKKCVVAPGFSLVSREVPRMYREKKL